MAMGYLTGVVSFQVASSAAKAAAQAGRKGATVKRQGSGWVAMAWSDADRSYAAADVVEGGHVTDETGRWKALDRVYGGGLSRERQATEAEQDLDVQTRVLAAIEAAEGELSDREKRLAQTLGEDVRGKRTRHVRTFASWYAAREFVKELVAAGVPERLIARDQNVVDWTDYGQFASAAEVREAIEEGRVSGYKPEFRTGLGDAGSMVEVALGRREQVFETVKRAEWYARRLRELGARNVKRSGFTVRWDA